MILYNLRHAMRHRAARMLCVAAHKGPFSRLARKVLLQRGYHPVDVLSMEDAAEISLPLAGPSPFRVEAPHRHKQPVVCSIGTYPSIQAHLIRNAMASPYSPGIIRGDKLCLPELFIKSRDEVATDTAGLFYIERSLAVGQFPNGRKLPKAIHIGGAGSFNWYHFVMECLPKVFLLRHLPVEFSDYPLLLPDECRTVPSFAEALSLFSGDRETHFVKKGEKCLVEKLVSIDEISCAPFNMRSGSWPRINDYSQHDNVIREFLGEFRERLIGDPKVEGGRRRIFLARPEGVRRDYNQQALLDIALRFGFEAVSPETLSLKEQAHIFASSEMVIGASGAAWVGLIFQDNPLIGLSWLIPEYSEFSSYSSLATLLKHRIEFIDAIPEKPVHSTGEAYNAGYQVSPKEFEDALRRLVGAS